MFKRASTIMVAAGLAVSSILTPVAASPAEAAGLPDLQLAYTGPSTASTGSTFSFKVKMSNVGRAATPRGERVQLIGKVPHGFTIEGIVDSSSDFECAFENDVQFATEPTWGLFICESHQPFAPNASVVALVQATASSNESKSFIDVRADDLQEIAESDESNNSLNTPFLVQ